MLPPLTGGLIIFLQVGLRFDEMCLQFSLGLFLLQIGLLVSEAFLKFPCFRDKDLGNADDFNLCDGISCRGHLIDTLIQPRVENFEWLVRIEGLPELPVMIRQDCCRYLRVVHVEVAEEGHRG